MADREIIETLGTLGPDFIRLGTGERAVVTLEVGLELYVCINGIPISERRNGKWKSLGPLMLGKGTKRAPIDVVDLDGGDAIELRMDGKPLHISSARGGILLLSAYSANADFITLSDFDNTAVVTDLNNLGVPTPHIFATPLKVGIYMFTTDSGQLGYGASGLNNSNALSTTTDLGWMRIDIAPSAQVTKFGLLVGLPGPKQHNHEAVLFFDNYNHLLGSTGVSRGGGFQFVAFENPEGLIGSVVIQDADLNSSSFVVDNLVSQSRRP